MQQLKAEHGAALEQMKAEHETAVEKLQVQHAAAMQVLQEKHEAALAKLQAQVSELAAQGAESERLTAELQCVDKGEGNSQVAANRTVRDVCHVHKCACGAGTHDACAQELAGWSDFTSLGS